jgi:hypothetical protein
MFSSRSTLDQGEMSFGMFEYSGAVEVALQSSNDPMTALRNLQAKIGSGALPDYLLRYIESTTRMTNGVDSIAIHHSGTVEKMRDADKERISRSKGLMGQAKRDFPAALHHFKIFFNDGGMARIVYRFNGNITFLKNVKNARRV